MSNIIEKVEDKALENVSGGYSILYSAQNKVEISQEEYDALTEEGFIKDGKLLHSDCHAVAEFLKNKGFKGTESFNCFMHPGYKKPEYANVVITDTKK